MLNIIRFTVEGLAAGCVTDEAHPRFSFALDSDRANAALKRAVLRVGDRKKETDRQIAIPYGGPALEPFTVYTASVEAEDDAGEKAQAELTFETGRLDTPWTGQWISDPAYQFTEKKVSPRPMTFRKRVKTDKIIASARIYATAMGVYELTVNGKKAGNRYFAPGFTSYNTNLQYQTYDVTDLLTGDDELRAVVAGGWAVGSFVFTRSNRYAADRQALLLELRLTYEDGSVETVGTDGSWEVTEEGPYKMADLYDGETYDATARYEDVSWRNAAPEKLRVSPKIIADYGAPVKAHERLKPVFCKKHPTGPLIYDFGQNFAGVVELKLKGKRGQTVTVRHAEILNPDGTLNTQFLRTAKATATYTCVDGEQVYSPRLTYMGFRYISVEGVDEANVEVTGIALYSDMEQIGSFSCSNEMLNQLQSNIVWGAKSNLVDIPTDCPQRDERMGWTGDIAVFSPTACFNFDMGRFLDKWLRDVKAEQFPGGGIPNTVPRHSYGFPSTMPDMAVDWWDDACVLVPWAEYRARGDVEILRKYYPVMKKYVKACAFWAGLLSAGKNKYIWDTPAVFHFGDWVAPDVPKMSQWQGRSKWTATASLRNTSGLLAQIAEILGEDADAARYRELSEKVADAYCSVLTDGNGKLLEEFQTAYVLPLHLDMFPTPEVKAKAADNLVKLVEKSGCCIGTGFPGTPYILFALADNGHADTAYKMLLNDKCPSWLYEVKMGATTIWERWDGLDENGVCPIGDDGTDTMISYNHYASGAVGDFLYRRVLGLEAIEPGYKTFAVKPVPGGGLTWAKGGVRTPYGEASVDWKIEGGTFTVNVRVPVGTRCELTLPYVFGTMGAAPVVGQTWNKDLAREYGEVCGNYSLWANLTIYWGCGTNLHRVPYNARNHDYYSEDAVLTAGQGNEFVQGGLKYGCLISPKHLAFNDTEINRSGVATFMTEQQARENELRGSQAPIENGALAIMTAYNRVGITQDNAHTGLMKNILHGEWGFKGLISEDFIMDANYTVLKEAVMNGITMSCNTGENSMAAVSEKYSYWTLENVGKDAQLMAALKQAMTWQNYALAQSNALDGLSSNSRLVSVRTWYDNLVTGLQVGFGVLTLACAAAYVMSGKKKG